MNSPLHHHRGTVHQNQCDTPFLVGNIGRAFVGVYSPLDAHTAMDINNRLMLNFIAKHLGETERERES